MDAGGAECPGDWPNTVVEEDREFPEGLSVRMVVLPRGEELGEAPTATKRADGWKYGFGSDEAHGCWPCLEL